MSRLKLGIPIETLRPAEPFRISSHIFDARDAVVATRDNGTIV